MEAIFLLVVLEINNIYVFSYALKNNHEGIVQSRLDWNVTWRSFFY